MVDILDHKGTLGTVSDQLERIKALMLKDGSPTISLVVHNIDGLALKNHQQIFCSLANICGIQLVCSIDHLDASLNWDMSSMTRFNFAWHDTSTFNTYHVETSFENTLIKSSQVRTTVGAMHVLKTLGKQSRQVFQVLLNNQIETKQGLPYAKYFRTCNEHFLVSTELGFKTCLTEFKDHNLVISKKQDFGNILEIGLGSEILKELAAEIALLTD